MNHKTDRRPPRPPRNTNSHAAGRFGSQWAPGYVSFPPRPPALAFRLSSPAAPPTPTKKSMFRLGRVKLRDAFHCPLSLSFSLLFCFPFPFPFLFLLPLLLLFLSMFLLLSFSWSFSLSFSLSSLVLPPTQQRWILLASAVLMVQGCVQLSAYVKYHSRKNIGERPDCQRSWKIKLRQLQPGGSQVSFILFYHQHPHWLLGPVGGLNW